MTLQGNDLDAAIAAGNDQLRAIALGEATGDAAIGEFFVTVAELIAAGVRSFDDVGSLYAWRYDVMNAEKKRRGRETQDMPSGNSLSAQLTKAKTIAQLGTYEAKRTGTIALVRAFAGDNAKVAWKYAPLVVASRAVAVTLDASPAATDDNLRDAMHAAVDEMPVKAKSASAEIAKIAKAFDKLQAGEFKKLLVEACASPDTDADLAKVGEELSLLLNAVVAHEAKAGGKRKA